MVGRCLITKDRAMPYAIDALVRVFERLVFGRSWRREQLRGCASAALDECWPKSGPKMCACNRDREW